MLGDISEGLSTVFDLGRGGENLSEMRGIVQNEAGGGLFRPLLQNQHGVPIRVEAVAGMDRFPVGPENPLAPGERGN